VSAGRLARQDLASGPLALLEAWLADAQDAGMRDANAMTIATAGADGRPSARTVLLRGLGDDGLRFYTNRLSLKGRQLAENPRAQALLFWRELGRQVLVHGPCVPTSDADSDAYFATRPREAQLGAWASEQGAALAGEDELDRRLAEAAERYAGGPVPRPPHWGGYLLGLEAVEFWQAGEFRLHDRFVAVRDPGAAGPPAGWRVERLSP
jgi:pyridoxamine 5'-phosphate oxidase